MLRPFDRKLVAWTGPVIPISWVTKSFVLQDRHRICFRYMDRRNAVYRLTWWLAHLRRHDHHLLWSLSVVNHSLPTLRCLWLAVSAKHGVHRFPSRQQISNLGLGKRSVTWLITYGHIMTHPRYCWQMLFTKPVSHFIITNHYCIWSPPLRRQSVVYMSRIRSND